MTEISELPAVAFIGAGKVASALARTWASKGIRIAAVAGRTAATGSPLAAEVGARAVEPHAAPDTADLIVLAVSDDAIEATSEGLATGNWAGKAVIHTSGAHSLHSLRALAGRGAMTGSLHPAYPFAGRDVQPAALRGVTFAIEADDARLKRRLLDLVDAAEGRPLTLRPEQKARYHAALVMTSNYAVSLYSASRRLLDALGADQDAADSALLALLGGTLANLHARGVPGALTGPLARGDAGTVHAHLQALADAPEILNAYIALSRLTLSLIDPTHDKNAITSLLDDWEQR